MLHYQPSHVSSFSRPVLRRDFISLLPKRGLDHVAENILSNLDAKSLCAAELVCKEWYQVISEGMLWKKKIERLVRTDSLWRRLMERRGCIKYLFKLSPGEPRPDHTLYKRLYREIIQDIENIEANWRRIGSYSNKRIRCQGEISVYCVQYDDHKIVSGLSDSTIKIWDPNTLQCVQVLRGHAGPVMCLQFDDRVIISGSTDSTVKVWDVKTGELINTLIHHADCVFQLRFNNGMMVTSSADRSIAVWNMVSPSEITVQRVLGHIYPVRTVDFDEKYIVSADGRAINVFNTSTCELVRSLRGHAGGVLCLQYRDRLVVSGGFDKTIRLWDIESGACLRTLEGHIEYVRCVQFDNKRILSGGFYGEIKVWDLAVALNHAPAGTLCLRTLLDHSGIVFSVKFDDFQIVSSSSDDSILIWDFLNCTPKTPALIYIMGIYVISLLLYMCFRVIQKYID